MIKDLPPPTEAEEYRNTAEILRDLAAQVRFGSTRTELVSLAANLDRLATHAEDQIARARELTAPRATPQALTRSSHGSQQEHQCDKFGISHT